MGRMTRDAQLAIHALEQDLDEADLRAAASAAYHALDDRDVDVATVEPRD